MISKATFEIIDETCALERKSVSELLLKMQEELGEAAQAYLSYSDAPGCGYKGKTVADFHEELADMQLVLASLMAKSGLAGEPMDDLLRKKLYKWQRVLAGNKT